MKNISEHITYKEAIHSDTAKRLNIPNTPNEKQLASMEIVAKKVFEPLRIHFGVPIYISSFFRSIELNRKIKGAKGSKHLKGEAIDIDADVYGGVTNKEIFDYIKDNLGYDQVILENVGEDGTGGWVHVSYANRNEVLIMIKVNGKSTYKMG